VGYKEYKKGDGHLGISRQLGHHARNLGMSLDITGQQGTSGHQGTFTHLGHQDTQDTWEPSHTLDTVDITDTRNFRIPRTPRNLHSPEIQLEDTRKFQDTYDTEEHRHTWDTWETSGHLEHQGIWTHLGYQGSRWTPRTPT
jgi:hypothetical protein